MIGKRLERHDVSDLVGLHVIVANAVREIVGPDGEVAHEVPDPKQLACAAAVQRCLIPIRLRGKELRAIRRIAGWTAADLAERLGDKVATETISKWENDKQLMGGYAEKVFRLIVCEALHREAPGVEYHDGAIAKLRVIDPWRNNQETPLDVPAIVFDYVKVRDEDRRLVDAWAPEDLPLAA
jgi:transcriptional regulator with XRE-family HTH domain